ncbi:hypothetical protein HETIRDRAFT_327052 [Heterobasidion irregulare TC 32-1]|uniref:CCHC-type domain-containing protein n=1 Tax=Heterobasidion irregulare (strain TC 32-1) TaxID=747525 RepID=W4JVS3_HETIT|nr:uncharacterized protein HETIRDRAFT_327052 [Heterobasidion irregulare TC 32-1]ETW77180.1 hypothetical protein HETIRDRAFT_327052 [Heterobasidion irregulare TC 32-1]
MSLAVRKFHFLESPCYIMSDFHHTASSATYPHSTSPSFILRPVSVTFTDSYDSLASVDHNQGITVDDPQLKIGIPDLPSHILNPHTPSAAQVFALFNTTPRTLIPIYPSPLYDLTHYLNPNLIGALYYITFTNDKAPIMLEQNGLDDPTNFFFYLQQIVMTCAYQVHQGPLDRHQMTLLSNVAVTNYRNKRLLNLPALRSDMISYCPNGYSSLSMNLLLRHSPTEWIDTLKRIPFQRNMIRWFRITGFGRERLVIEEYMLGGTLPERLFPTNRRGEQHVAAYWSEGANPSDNMRPWYMTRTDVVEEDGYHLLRLEELLYELQQIIDAPGTSGNTACPPAMSLVISLPVLRESPLTPIPLIAPSPPLPPLQLNIPVPFQHPISAERTTAIEEQAMATLPHTHAEPFPGNRLAPIPNLEEDDPMHPTSPIYDPEQAVRDHEVSRPLPMPPPAPPTTPTSPTLVGSDPAPANPFHTPSSQLAMVPVASEDWRKGAQASELIWPATPAFTPSPPTSPTPPEVRYCWECGRSGHLLAGCSITHIQSRTDVTTHQFLRDYDVHHGAANQLRLQMDKVAEEYGYHKQAWEHMIDTALWAGYPTRSVPTYDVNNPRNPPPVTGPRPKRRRLV